MILSEVLSISDFDKQFYIYFYFSFRFALVAFVYHLGYFVVAVTDIITFFFFAMVINHICGENCFTGRGSRNKLIKCRLCDHSFNLKCFNINITLTKSYFESDSHVIFICYKCHPYLIKQNSSIANNRKSLSTTQPGNRKSTSIAPSSINTSNNSSIKGDLNNQLQLLNKILDKLSITSNLQQQLPQQQHISAPVSQTIPILDHNQLEQNELHTQTIIQSQHDFHLKTTQMIDSIITEKLDSFKHFIASSTIDYNKFEEILIKNKCGNKIFNNRNICKVNNPLEWSFSSINQSHNASVNESRPDLFQLWHSFEANTWTALDNISHQVKMNSNKMNDMNDCLMDIENTIRNVTTNNINRSALTETIQNEKYNSNIIEDIHRELNDLKQCFSSLSESQMEKEVIDIMRTNDVAPISSDNEGQTFNKNETETNGQAVINTNNRDRSYVSKIHNHNIRQRELYVSRFKTHITASHIEQFLVNNGITVDRDTKITPLINPKCDLKMLSFISFKIDTSEDIAKIITADNFWPNGCLIKDFRHKKPNNKPNGPIIIDENFLVPPIITPAI